MTDFTRLSEAEQRAVAERLLKIQQSGWKPFWCPDQRCSGDPHHLKGPVGQRTYVADTVVAGPKGEPVGWEDAEGRITLKRREGLTYKTLLLDPQWAHNHAREDQRLPPWNEPWTLFLMTGRGGGKSRTGVEFVTLSARRGIDGAIIGRRGTELVNTHVAALIEHAHPEFVPEYQASKDLILWPNGAKTFLFSAERPENIRSINVSYAWLDEASHMDEIVTAWMNIKLATRIEVAGNPLHFLITSTPTPTKWTMAMEDDPDVIVRRVSTYANRANLSDDYLKAMEKEYEGTRMGRQELHGEVLRDVEGALWNEDMFTHQRAETYEEFEAFLETMDDIVVAVDPAGSKGKRSDATAIVAAGRQNSDDGRHVFFVLGATQLKGSPEEWSEATFKMARLVRANRITVERNFGGDMVKTTLTNHARMNPDTSTDEHGMDFKIEESRAVKGKETRAEPVVGRYEQGRVIHLTSPTVYGDLSELEKEQTTWVPKSRGGKMASPNLIDANVWTITALETAVKYAAQSANRDVLKQMRGVGQRYTG